jgi:hypothetical protein
MQDAMMRRIGDHIAYWKQKQTELETAAANGDDGIQRLCERVLTLLRRAGVHACHVQDAMGELGNRLNEYQQVSKGFRTASATHR